MNKQSEILEISRFFSRWLAEISLSTALDYFDINKISEGLALKILNLIYDYELKDLNEESKNFPGLDLGDRTKSKIAFQITSRYDYNKIKENLETFVSKKYNFTDSFTQGIKFLILNHNKVIIGKKNPPESIYSNFNVETDIIYFQDIIKEIEKKYDEDYETFTKIKLLLNKEFGQNVIKIEDEKKGIISSELVLFTDYHNECEPYYYKRKNNLDDLFLNLLQSKNLWIYGDSGNGKSAFSKRNLCINNVSYHYCYLSSYQLLENSDAIFEDLFSSIFNLHEDCFLDYKIVNNTNLLNKVAESLNIAFKSENVVVFFDEFYVPNVGIFKDFVDKIIRLTQLYNHTNKGIKQVKFVISTITSPKEFIVNFEKSKEYFEFLTINKWEDEELEALCVLLNKHLNQEISLSIIKRISNTTHVNPRYVKEVYRKFNMYKEHKSNEQIISLLQNEKIT